jgi:hypothetical protein
MLRGIYEAGSLLITFLEHTKKSGSVTDENEALGGRPFGVVAGNGIKVVDAGRRGGFGA